MFKFFKASLFASLLPSIIWGLYCFYIGFSDPTSNLDSAFQFAGLMIYFSALFTFSLTIVYCSFCFYLLKKVKQESYLSIGVLGIVGSNFTMCYVLGKIDFEIFSIATFFGLTASQIFYKFVK